MSTLSAAYYLPTAAFQPGYTSRLRLIEPRVSFGWDTIVARVPQLVGEVLSSMDGVVCEANPDIVARSGQNTIRGESLFVYRTYSRGANDGDAIVVGLTVELAAARIIVRGDIADEEGGNIYSELKAQTFDADNERTLVGVKKAAEELASHSSIVAEAVAGL